MERENVLWLTGLEYDVMTCASESWGILPYLIEHRRPDGEWPSTSEAAVAVLSFVDRGWVEVHRLEPATFEDGRSGAKYSEPIDHSAVATLLTDADTWNDPTGDDWFGEFTLSQTPDWSAFRAGRTYSPMPSWTTR